MNRSCKCFSYARLSMLCLLFCMSYTFAVVAQTATALTNADVVDMVKKKLSPTVIEAVIKTSATQFDTSVKALSQLGKSGVPDSVVALMIEQTKAQGNARPLTSEAGSSTPIQPPPPLGPKRPGIPRIGIVTTQATVPPEQDEAVRAQFYELIYGNRDTSSSEAILMREKLDRNIASEAVLTKCDYLLFLNLDSTIESAAEKRGNFIQKAVRSGAEAIGTASKLASPLTALTGITYRSYQMADSLSTSATLLSSITQATRKKDKIGVNFKLIKVGTDQVIIAQTLKEIIAKKDREPIFQNLLIQLGNEIVNSIPARR